MAKYTIWTTKTCDLSHKTISISPAMALINCVDCDKRISDLSYECLGCGCPVLHSKNEIKKAEDNKKKEEEEKSFKQLMKVLSLAIVLLLIYHLIILWDLGTTQNSSFTEVSNHQNCNYFEIKSLLSISKNISFSQSVIRKKFIILNSNPKQALK